MQWRQNIAAATAAAINAAGLGRPTQAALAEHDSDYAFLTNMRNLLLPATTEAGERDPLQRCVEIDRVMPGDEELVVLSFNGLDRRLRHALIPIEALRADHAKGWRVAIAYVLPEYTAVSATEMVFYEDVPPAGWEVVSATENHVVCRKVAG